VAATVTATADAAAAAVSTDSGVKAEAAKDTPGEAAKDKPAGNKSQLATGVLIDVPGPTEKDPHTKIELLNEPMPEVSTKQSAGATLLLRSCMVSCWQRLCCCCCY
jgi:hypothetical protein